MPKRRRIRWCRCRWRTHPQRGTVRETVVAEVAASLRMRRHVPLEEAKMLFLGIENAPIADEGNGVRVRVDNHDF